MLQNSPPQKNLVLEIESSPGTLEVRIVFKLRTSLEHLAVAFWSLGDLDLHLLSLMPSLECTRGSSAVNPLLLVRFFKH
jgi:hypothetical protein